MLRNILPLDIYVSISRVGFDSISEIRLRRGMPISVYILNTRYFLTRDGLGKSVCNDTIVCTSADIRYILDKVSDRAYHSISDELIKGYITILDGVRIGVSGQMVSVDGVDKSIKDISSLCIRIPHMIKNCSLDAYKYLVHQNKVYSTLVISKPGGGKTTFLKDFIYQLNKRCQDINIAVLDDRRELVLSSDRLENVDVYIPTDRQVGLESVIRSMSPSVVVLDELGSSDYSAIDYAISCGVSVVASIHADGIDMLRHKFKSMGVDSMFDRYVVLGSVGGVGTIDAVFNREYLPMYL